MTTYSRADLNALSAEMAGVAVKAFGERCGATIDADGLMVDLLVGLMHHCDAHHGDFEYALQRARVCYLMEKR